jgi:hypothetical protein
MALRTPPSWLQNGTHPADNDRLTTTGAIWKSQGVADYGSMKVSQSATPAMSVSVAAGHALINGTEVSNQGLYIAYNDAATTVAIATADPSQPRIDRVVVRVQDSYYSGATNAVSFAVVTGTPAGSPVPPSAPANSLTLAYVAVAANATSITNANITDTRVTAQFSEHEFTAQNTAANTIVVNGIALQTGKAIKVNDSTGTQKFAVSVDGTLTFQDGTTQTTAAAGGVTTVNGGTGITVTGTTSVSVAIDTSVTADLTTAQTLANKTLTSPKINLAINTQTGTTYTTVLNDNGSLVTLSNASAIALTIPLNSSVNYPVGAQINITQLGAGQVTVQGAGGVTVVSTGATASAPKLRAQYSSATLIQTSTNNWLVVGDIS